MTEPSAGASLDGDDLATWAALATVLEWLPPALDAPLVREFELTHFEYGVLYALAAADGRQLRVSTLAGYANSTISRVSRAVSRLQLRRLVERRRDALDGRSMLVALTAEGAELYDRATPVHAESVQHFVLGALTAAQRRQLREIAGRIQRAVRQDDGWTPPAPD
ncbi:MarR family winged helix-turn-helix transcriptional regulator [Herbiconiux sp. A18JL235]|uniref:MarR family winged helix-turn-helix transcriptional regulator n=1 Tax=Herbiconiux sp. A18JL235 TaxID=3152363 RepID=A0AB39BGN0_9MICO